MGISQRRDTEKTQMKKKIMEAAIEIMEEEGYEKLSLRKIAAKIEYSPTTIYLYYKDKAEIIKDMSDELYHKVMRSVIAVMRENDSLPILQQVHDTLRIFIKELCQEPEMAKGVMYSGVHAIFSNESPSENPGNSGIDLLDQLLSNGIAAKVFRPGIEHTSWMIVSAVLGFVMASISNELYVLPDFDTQINDFVDLIMGGITL